MAYIVDYDDFHTHRLYKVNIHGNEIKVTVTAVASVVRRWISTTFFHFRRNYLQPNRLVAGLGVQWTSNGRDPHPPPDTLQLCVGRRCLIFQLAHANYIPRNLRDFLQNPNHTFVGFWNHSDRLKLETSMHRFDLYRDPLDLRHYAEALDEDDDEDLARASVTVIVEKCLGYDVEDELRREIGRSDWDDEDLSNEQVVYASVDAYCAFLVGKNIKAWKYYT